MGTGTMWGVLMSHWCLSPMCHLEGLILIEAIIVVVATNAT